jgi:hypothetical protein
MNQNDDHGGWGCNDWYTDEERSNSILQFGIENGMHKWETNAPLHAFRMHRPTGCDLKSGP